MARSPNIKVVTDSPQMKRRLRSPQHPFNVIAKPWQIVPTMIAPVLPGETMKNAMMMSRIVSDPLKDKLVGWWAENYLFYVKHRDLDIRDNLVNMHLDGTTDMTAVKEAASVPFFHNGGINYARRAYEQCVKWYFRDQTAVEDGTWSKTIGDYQAAKINSDGWWQSMKLESVMPAPAEDELPGENPVIPDNAPEGYTGQYAQWEAMVAAGITDASFEDYLASFGVNLPAADSANEELHKPELLRYSRKFTYPTNTVEPTTGVPSSAAVWSLSERADKDRFFKEPGFLVAFQVVRPKVYLNNITGSVTSYMDHAFNWLPKILQDMAFMSLKEFANGTGPAPEVYSLDGGVTPEDYWVDLRDLFLHGEQFRNYATAVSGVELPDVTGNVDFATLVDADALFSGAEKYFRTDGLWSLNVASPIHKDHTL